MTPKEYLEFALTKDFPCYDYTHVVDRLENELRREKGDLMRLLHAGIGMSGEAGEIIDSLKKSIIYGRPIDLTNLKEECGDVLWYMAIMLHAIGSSFEEVMEMNKTKLNKRYPSGFTEKDAIARADKK